MSIRKLSVLKLPISLSRHETYRCLDGELKAKLHYTYRYGVPGAVFTPAT